ncbi:von Willebrand factor type A domain-containing protein [Mycena crocata]|nr:von Willebrand factor type A domain-containing protein [Mycena crocata]
MIFGLYYYVEQRAVSLPLLNISAQASVKELAAQVKLTQTYANDNIFPIEAKYAFPVPARAAVSAVCMIKQDGTRVVASVMEKQEARQTYDTAVSQGKQAALTEQQTPDVFQVSVGNIPANEQVQIELVYATELSEDEEHDSIRFHLPVHIGSRYGQAPFASGSTNISPSSKTPFLNISLTVEAIAPISKIACPSHSVSTELGPDPALPNFKDLPFSNYARISLSSDAALDKDFVVAIKSAGLDAPRCVAEVHPTADTVALALTLVPRFKLPDLSRQEFVFLVDRSGSMRNKRIAAARKALVVMLRALPHKDSLFQIMSFGNRCTALFEDGSRPYNQETLDEATRHVDGMAADYGGTQIRAALKQCFGAQRGDRPLSVLLLTDGDAWDVNGVLSEVKAAVAAAPEKAYLRVSVLGIGNSASTAMCEGIARVGNGTCMMIGEEETTFTGKLARMLKAARTPPILNATVDWGRPAGKGKEKEAVSRDDDEFELVDKPEEKTKTLNIFDDSANDSLEADTTPAPPLPVVLPPPAAVQQAPFVIRNLSPNIRLNIYVILQGKAVPKTVTIRGSTADGAQIELPISVTLSHLPNAQDAPPAVHALSARKLIQDLEDGQHALVETLTDPDDADLLTRTVEASIVRLGKTYSIASSQTSFVAVDEPAPPVDLEPPPSQPHSQARGKVLMAKVSKRARPVNFMGTPKLAKMVGEPSGASWQSVDTLSGPELPLQAASLAPSGSSVSSSASAGNPPQPEVLQNFFQSLLTSKTSPPPMTMRARSKQGEERQSAATRFTDSRGDEDLFSLLFFVGPSSVDGGAMRKSAVARSTDPLDTRLASVRPLYSRSSLDQLATLDSAAIEPATDPLEALARLQSFDGRFSLGVLTVIKLSTDIESVRGALPAGATDGVVATLLAMAFLSTKLGADVDRDSWEGIYEKAQQYVEAALQDMGAVETVDVLEKKVVQMLA